jgi:4-coumarate--CoA ligase
MKVKGFRVNPSEIEARLLEHPDVSECCVVPIPHEFSGEVPKAYIVLSAKARQRIVSASEEIQLKDNLLKVHHQHLPYFGTLNWFLQHASYQRISYKHLVGGIEFLDSIPKTASGKLLRRVLRFVKS